MRLVSIAVPALLVLVLPVVSSAETSAENCTGFIDSVPAIIGTQGVWCMNKDLSTGAGSGAAITVAGNNITVDCNNFKLGGLAAGPSTQAVGIGASDRNNVTVRNCNVRGFRAGVQITGDLTSGHVVEDSRFDGSTFAGIRLVGDGSVIRRNLVLHTGAVPSGDEVETLGIYATGNVDVVDNHISGVLADQVLAPSEVYGIRIEFGDSATIKRNTIRGLAGGPGTSGTGIDARSAYRALIEGNTVYLDTAYSLGILCSDNNITSIRGNAVLAAETRWSGACVDLGNNVP